MPRSNSRHSPNRSRSKSSSRSGITRSQSRRGKSSSPNRHVSDRHRRSQERRHSPSPRRKSTERPLQSGRSSSQNRTGSRNQTKNIKSFTATVDELMQSCKTATEERTEERTTTPPRSPSRSRSKSRSPSKKERRKSPRTSSSHSRKEGRKSPRTNSSPSKKEREKSPRASSSHSRKERRKSPRPNTSPSNKERRKSPINKTPHRKSPERSLQWDHSPLQSRSYQQTMLTLLLPDEQIWEENGIDMKSLRLNAAEELSKLPKVGEIYSEVEGNVENIFKRLKHLSEKLQKLSINEANEIADATILLRFLRKSNNEIQMAGKMAHKGALLMLQAEVLSKKGKELLEQSKNKLKSIMS